MEIVALRLVLAPSIVLIATITQRRLGPLRGGQLIGLPLTTGPFLAVIGLEYGRAEAAHAALGVIAGQAVVAGFCLGYGHLAAHVRPLWALAGALASSALAGSTVAAIQPGWLAAVAVWGVVVVGLLTWPAHIPAAKPSTPRPQGAKPAQVVAQTALRMAVAGGLVGTLATAARVVGAFLAGILSAAPVILSVVVPATHRGSGPAAAADLVRGTLAGVPGAVAFTAVVAYTVDGLGAVPGFATGIAALLLVNLLPWRRLAAPARRRPIEVVGAQEYGDPVSDEGNAQVQPSRLSSERSPVPPVRS